jgi:3-oxoacyl-[acyl-carrier-protein] synthase-1
MTPLTVHGYGAVTCVGLDAMTSCAAIRAGVSGFREAVLGLPPAEPQIIAAIPAHWRLKRNRRAGLVNLASRGIREAIRDEQPSPAVTQILLVSPEHYRDPDGTPEPHWWIRAVERSLGIKFHPGSSVVTGGPAAMMEALLVARERLTEGRISHCIVGGVDSLINSSDMTRLAAAGRLKASDNPQGIVPGEAACFLLLSARTQGMRCRPIAQILGVGVATESDTALGSRFSVGNGLTRALQSAVADSGLDESAIGFVVSTFNGERYGAWELMMGRPRFYRTRREQLPVIYPAMSLGETGAASPAITIMMAALAIGREYAPAPIAACEAASDEGLRGACLIGPPPELPAFDGLTRQTYDAL